MGKYIDADRLKEEFQKRFDICMRVSEDDRNTLDTRDWYRGKYTAYSESLSFIDSLQQEQPEVDLEKEINACWQNWLSPSNQKEIEGVLPKTEFTMYARHFYELGKKQ